MFGLDPELIPDKGISSFRTNVLTSDQIMTNNFINEISNTKVFDKSSGEDEFLSSCSSSSLNLLHGTPGRHPLSKARQKGIFFCQRPNLRSEIQ